MTIIEKLVEQRIKTAQERGELDNLPGQGRPLQLDDDSAVPAELCTGYRLLKNAGFLPPELEKRMQVKQAEALLAHIEDDTERSKVLQKISLMKAQLSKRGYPMSTCIEEQIYREKLLAKIAD